MFKTKYHWWNMVFVQQVASGIRLGNVYHGSTHKYVQKKDIKHARIFEGFAEDSILIACSYLGKMTRDTFNEDHIPAPHKQNELKKSEKITESTNEI